LIASKISQVKGFASFSISRTVEYLLMMSHSVY